MIQPLRQEQSKELTDFLALVFGEKFRGLAAAHINGMFQEGLVVPHFLIKEQGSQIIGAACLTEAIFTIDTWGISWVGVHPSHRKQDIGRDLIKACLKEIGKRNPPRATALLSSFSAAVPFYKKLGFDGTTADHCGEPFLAVPVISE